MPPPGKPQNRLFTILCCLIVIAGCTSLGRIPARKTTPPEPQVLPDGVGWWYARFRLDWPPDTDPIWYLDLYIAHRIIQPVFQENRDDILLWRFHRRAARDKSGRQFSFIFYASPQTARRIYQEIENNPEVEALKSAGLVETVVFDDPAKITRPAIEDTSDRNWSVSIQKTWPYYIMGVSRMWLGLIAEIADGLPDNHSPESMAEIQSTYRQIDETVNDLWLKEGRHAFLHHLNALFGYKPLIYYEKRFLTF